MITETLAEILADKLVALPTSITRLEGEVLVPTPAKIRHRDIWDIVWLLSQGTRLELDLVYRKIADYGINRYDVLLANALETIHGIATGEVFKNQMQRFITKSHHERAFGTPGYDEFMAAEVIKTLAMIKRHPAAVLTGAKPKAEP